MASKRPLSKEDLLRKISPQNKKKKQRFSDSDSSGSETNNTRLFTGKIDQTAGAKKRRSAHSVDKKITIKQIKESGRTKFNEELLCKIIEIHDDYDKPERVLYLRRKIVLADTTGYVVGFIKCKLDALIETNDYVSIADFKYNHKLRQLTLHAASTIGQ